MISQIKIYILLYIIIYIYIIIYYIAVTDVQPCAFNSSCSLRISKCNLHFQQFYFFLFSSSSKSLPLPFLFQLLRVRISDCQDSLLFPDWVAGAQMEVAEVGHLLQQAQVLVTVLAGEMGLHHIVLVQVKGVMAKIALHIH